MTIPTETPAIIDWPQLYDDFVAGLRKHGVGNSAPGLNDRFEPFVLPNSLGRHVDLDELLENGPVVLSFMRGGWCPYCRAEMNAWAAAAPRLAAVGGRFIAISGEVGGRAETTRCALAPEAEVLCDIDHGLATSLGLSFALSPALHQSYLDYGLSLAEIYGDSGRILPIPATFVLDTSGIVRFAFVEPDFRIRADPAVVIAVVEALR
ncbi:AhpC/TSA family protein [Sphingosinicellaceae bacterium]|nr:AhpC/TSA family protein [Sphingosinicellaceae bacterium]